jgi:hypothetical protein
MAMLAEQYRYVIGGDPDRDTIDLAVLDTATGAVRAHLVEAADGPGYARMLAWADEHAPQQRVWALEGTGSFAAGLAQTLAEAGEAVVEVDAVKRARGAKNDHIDAVRAARSALAGEFPTLPRARGLPEAPADGPGHPGRRAGQPDQGDQRAEEPDHRRPRASTRPTAWPVPGGPAQSDRGASDTSRRRGRAPGEDLDAALDRRQGPIPAASGQRARPGVGVAGRPARGRTRAPRRTGESVRSSQRNCWCPGRTGDESATKLPSPPWQEPHRSRPAAASASGTGSTAAVTAT